jgi:hypothetical protein
MLARYGYEPETQELDVEFRSGDVWRYDGVSMETFVGFLRAASKGKYFLESIKGKHAEERR